MKATLWLRSIVCAASLSSFALAQAPADPSAEQLADQRFSEALSMMDAKRYAEACALFEESQRLAPASGTLLNLADCYQQLGRLAKASQTFAEAHAQAQRTGNVARQQVAQKRIEALAPRLAHLVISVPRPAPGLSVSLDGVDLPSTEWGTPQVIDPGAHAIRVAAPGRITREITLLPLAEGATRSLEIPELAPVAQPKAGAPVGSDSSNGEPSRTETTDWQTVGAIAGAAVGTVAVVGGTLFAAHSHSKHEESDRTCDGDDCFDQHGVDAMDDAIVAGDRATACFIVAGVGFGVAGVLWFARPFDSDDPAPTQVGVGPGRVELRVRW